MNNPQMFFVGAILGVFITLGVTYQATKMIEENRKERINCIYEAETAEKRAEC